MPRRRPEQTEEKKDRRIPTTRYEPEYKRGLTSQQVQEHRLHGWVNRSVEPPSKTTKEIIHENIFTYFNLIFAILAVLLILVGSFRDLTFLPVIIANTLIGIVQEIRAKQVLDKLTMLNAPHATVVRDGKKSVIDAEELVLDDIVIFKAGNQVCADAEVCAGEVQVNESLLTGEADEITKRKGAKLMSGSFIVSGQCHARLDKVGEDSYISKLTLQAKEMQEGEQSEMIRSLDKLVKCVGIAIIPIGLILFWQAFFVQHDGFRDSITSMVAAVIGMIPEGLYLLATVALAVSSIRLATKKVLLHNMKCIETLARVDVLCVDKTGTITENTMKVQDVISTDAYDSGTMQPLNMMIGDFAAAMDTDNITMAAVKEYFQSSSGAKPVSKTGFSSATKYSSVTFPHGAYVMGAPEFVLREKYEDYAGEITEHAASGARVLVFGIYDGNIDGRPLEHGITPLAFLLLANPVREAAEETFRYFAEQGVEVKVISGDNPVTVSRVAKQAGIQNAEKYADASELDTEEKMRDAVLGNTVSGSDAAAQASQLVLLESDFSCMPQVVLEGRRVVNNIQRSATLFLVKNIFSFLLSLISVAFAFTYPLEPSQISLISMFTIGAPAFFLALEPNKNRIKGHFLTNVFLKALPAAITDALAVGALVIFGRTFHVNSTDISTAATMLLAIVGFMILYKISAPMNVLRTVILCGCIAGLLFCSIYLNDLFAITGMTMECIMLFVVFAIATEPVLRYLTILVGKLRFYYQRLRGRNPEAE